MRSLAFVSIFVPVAFLDGVRTGGSRVLDELAAGRVVNRITVPPHVKHSALIALNRMLSNVSAQPVAAK